MQHKLISFFTDKSFNKVRLDVCLSSKIKDLSRSHLIKIIKSGLVKVNDKIVYSQSKKLLDGDKVELKFEDKKLELKELNINIDTIFEDKDILIINKPSGIVVHPGAGNKHNTIVNYLVYKYKKNLSNLGGSDRPGIVHRLDKNTSGLLVIAKNNFSHSHLGNQFKNHTIERTYLALILGVMRPLQGRIETLISRDKRNRQIMSVSQNKGKKAITNYKTLKVFNKKNLPKISFVEFKLETGRTHQIRLHVKYKGCSVLGDEQYGNKKIRLKKPPENFEQIFQKLNGQVLHAKTLGFEHPRNGEKVNFDCDLPYNFSEILNFLGSKS